MSRLQIALPPAFFFSTQIVVQIGDINYGRHLSNDAVLRMCHEARLRFLHALSFNEMDVDGRALIMADASIKFINQAFHSDELTFNLAVSHIGRAGFTLITQITNPAKDIEIARVQNGLVFFDYDSQSICLTPPKFIEKLSDLADPKGNT